MFMPSLRRAALALILVAAGPAHACLVCVPMPELTIADRVVGADVVALARADPDDPFRYRATEYLKGDAAGAPGPIPFLVDSATRRRMAADPEMFAVIGRETPGSDWELHTVGGTRTVAAIREIADRSDRWRDGAGDRDRFAFFAALHGSPDPGLRSLALAEISGSPYGLIRTLAPKLSRAEIVSVLRDPAMFEWAPIHILLLGLSEDPADEAFVRSAFKAAARSRSTATLGAWTTAYLEVDGAAALERIGAEYVGDPARSDEEMTQIVRALATFAAVAEPDLRGRIVEQFEILASVHPDSAGEIASELTLARNWSLADLFEDLLEAGAVRSPADEFAMRLHVGLARDADALGIR